MYIWGQDIKESIEITRASLVLFHFAMSDWHGPLWPASRTRLTVSWRSQVQDQRRILASVAMDEADGGS